MKNKLFIVIAAITFAACGEKNEEPSNSYLVSSQLVSSTSMDNIKTSFNAAGQPDLAAKIQYGVAVYKVTYNTTYKGENIVASGLIAFPDTDDPLPIVSFQHGTIATSSEAPSVAVGSYSQLSWFGGIGYIMAFPDFIGYGESEDVLHPYYHAESTAASVVDMILAASELAKEKSLNFDNDVYLAGYSEGGFATMVTHKAMEENDYGDLNLIASAPGSGGYDIVDMAQYFNGLDTYNQPFYIAFVAMSYQQTYEWDDPLSLYFKEPYASAIPDLFDGNKTSGQINDGLTDTVADLLQDNFRTGLETEAAFSKIYTAFQENSPINWSPQKTMIMYHGTADITVPFSNSEKVFNQLKSNGAADLTFISIEGGDHGSAFFPYLLDVIDKFDELQ